MSRREHGLSFEVDFGDLEEHLKRLENLASAEVQKAVEEFHIQTIRELAQNLLNKTINRTPVGEYGPTLVEFTTRYGEEVSFIANIAKTGGTLRRGWEVGDIVKEGNVYKVEIVNPVLYAAYVEYGHRTREQIDGSRGWVKGRFMLTISEQELNQEAPAYIEARLNEFLEGLING